VATRRPWLATVIAGGATAMVFVRQFDVARDTGIADTTRWWQLRYPLIGVVIVALMAWRAHRRVKARSELSFATVVLSLVLVVGYALPAWPVLRHQIVLGSLPAWFARLSWSVAIAGGIGLLAAFARSLEKLSPLGTTPRHESTPGPTNDVETALGGQHR
jgi:hypothetical protein